MSSRTQRWVVLVSLLFLLFSSLGLAQQWAGRGRIQGKVSDQNGEAIENAKVTLRKDGVEGQGPDPIATDKKGKWSYLGLGGGNWSIIVESVGMVPREGEVRVSEFGAGPNLKVALEPIPVDTGENTRGALNEANEFLKNGKYAEARESYAVALEGIEDEHEAPIYHAIGDTYRLEGKQKEARAAYDKAMSLLPPEEHGPVLRGVAQSYSQEGNVDKALETLDKILEASPGDAATLRVIIMVLVDNGREQEAQKYMDQLPAGETLDPNTLLNMGITAYNEGEIEKSLGLFDRAANENPDLADVYYYRGLARLNSNDTEGAKADFSKLIEIAPNHGKAEEAKQFLEYL